MNAKDLSFVERRQDKPNDAVNDQYAMKIIMPEKSDNEDQGGFSIDSLDSPNTRKYTLNQILKAKLVRPASMQLDRFGRVAFNKNREISQASLPLMQQVGVQPNSSQGSGSQLGPANNLRANQALRVFLSHQDYSKLNQKEVKREQDRFIGQKDPMQLEFNHNTIITRLNKMKNVLQNAQVINQIDMR